MMKIGRGLEGIEDLMNDNMLKQKREFRGSNCVVSNAGLTREL
jgi:hypothetical protein